MTDFAEGFQPRQPMRMSLDGRAEFACPEERAQLVQGVFAGRYNATIARPPPRPVRRVLDWGAGAGEFACLAYIRWPGCWVDWIEDDERLAELAAENAPPGAKRLTGGALEATAYDVVRLAGLGAKELAEVLPLFQEAPILIIDCAEVRHVVA